MKACELRAELSRVTAQRDAAVAALARARSGRLKWGRTPRGKLLHKLAVYRYRLRKATDPETRAGIEWTLADAARELAALGDNTAGD